MKTYPAEITPELLKKYESIPDSTVAVDIADTEREISDLRRQQKAEEEIARVSQNDAERKIAAFKADGRPHQIEERQRFVDFLKRLQAARAAAQVPA